MDEAQIHQGLPEVELKFWVVGDFDPEELSTVLGIEADVIHRKGDPMGKLGGDMKYKHDYWIISGGTARTMDVGGYINALIDRLSPHSAKIGEYVRRHRLSASIVGSVWVYGDKAPYLSIDANVHAKLAQLHAGLDIEVRIG